MLAEQKSPRYTELTQRSNRELEEIFRKGIMPAAESLVDHEWRGFNTPAFARLLGIQKFIKGFFRVSANDPVEGYNIPVKQNGLDSPWQHKPSADAPKRFGFYHVYPVRPEDRENHYPEALLLNYGISPRNPAYRVERLLRDYLIQPDPDNPDILLGKAYLAVGGLRIPSNFFVLERLRRVTWSQ